MTDISKRVSQERRKLIQGAAAGAGAAALFGGFGFNPLVASAMAKEAGMSPKPLKAAFSNAGLQATWCAQGKQAAEYWGVSTRTLRRYIKDGITPAPMARGSKNGKLIFDRLALDAAMDALSERVA